MDKLKDPSKYKEIYSDERTQQLKQAFDILGKLTTEAWGSPDKVTLEIAKSLIHAKDEMGKQLAENIMPTPIEDKK